MLAESFFHVLNPKKRDLPSINKFLQNHPESQSIFIEKKTHPSHMETVVEWLLREKYENVAVWGGDGTFNRFVQALYQMNGLSKVRVALVPAGTCNDFARHLHLPRWPEAEKLLDRPGHERLIDVGLLETEGQKRIFMNNAGFGRTPSSIQNKKSNPLRDILNFSTKKMNLDWENGEGRHFEMHEALFGIVFNAPYFNCGMHFQKDIEPTDQLLHAFFEPPQSTPGLIWKFLKSRWGKSLQSRSTFELLAKKLTVESDQDLFPQVDGDRVGDEGVRSVKFSILPQALKLVTWN